MSQTHNRVLIIVILGALSTISPFAIDMYLPAFPEIAKALQTTTAKVSLSLASYFAGLAAGQLAYGPLLDRFGRKLPLYAGLWLFIAASVSCLFAQNVESLIALRFVQAVGGCAAGVAAMAMVRDFFPAHETAKIISLLILVISASPMLAPSVGVFVAVQLGWQWVFIVLAAFVLMMLVVSRWVLPEGHPPDRSVSLRLRPILQNYFAVLREPQFLTYSVAGAFAFSGLLVECPTALLLLVGTWFGWFGLPATLVLLFIALSSLGLAYPNAAALALVPFSRNIGSASAMLGFLQIGISGLASASIGIFDSKTMLPVALVFMATSWIAFAILVFGKRFISEVKYVEESGAVILPH